MKYLNQKYYQIMLSYNVLWLLSGIAIIKEENIYLIVGFCALSFMTLSLNLYLLFLKKVTLSLDKTSKYLNLYYKKSLLKTYNIKEIKTDDKKWAYILDKDFILFSGIVDLTMEKKDLNLDIFKDIDDIKIINERKLFFHILTHNKYFRWNIIAFLIMPISAILSQFG